MEQEQNKTGQVQSVPMMSEQEMEYRQKYLRQPMESKEQRDMRNANVRQLLKDSRDKTVGVSDKSVLKSFKVGRGE